MADDWDTLSGADHDLLKPTYRMSRFVLDDVIHKGTLYDLDQKINLTQIGVTNFKHWDDDTWDEIFTHYGGFTCCLAIALFLVVALLVGAICCCCFCCCKCCKRNKTPKNCADISTTSSSSRRQKKMSGVEVVCLVLFLLIIGAMLMGVVIMFVSRSALQNELKYDKVYTKVENTAIETEKFVEDTWDEAQRIVLGIYTRAQNNIIATLNKIPESAQKLVETQSDARVILDKQKLFFETIGGSADAVDEITTTLQEDATSVGAELARLSAELTRLVLNCDAEQPCQTALSGFSVSADYTGLQNLNDISQTASEAERVTQNGYAEINKVEGEVFEGIETDIIEVEDAMNDGYREVTKLTNDIKKTIHDLNLVERVQDYDKKSTRDDVGLYLDIFYGCTAALCCLLLPVIVLYLGGLFFGVFGKDYKTSSCFRKSKAPCMIRTGVYLLFFLLILVILVSFVLLIAGGIIHTETCRYFARTKKYQPSLYTIDNIIREEIDIDVKYVEAVVACERDVALFDALGFVELDTLDTSLNETMDPDEYNIPGELDGLGSVIIKITNVKLLHEDKLLAVNDSLSDLDYDSYQDALSGNVTTGDLSTLIDDLIQYTNTSSDPSAFATLLEDLRAVEGNVSSMEEEQARGISEITTIRDTALGQPVQGQIDELLEAEKKINDDSDDLITNLLVGTVAGVLDTVEKLFEELADAIETKIGRCGPLHTTVYDLLSYVCVDVLYPFNALWFGMGWFVLFSIISMFVAFKVASIFQVHQATQHYYSNTYSPEPVYVKNSYM